MSFNKEVNRRDYTNILFLLLVLIIIIEFSSAQNFTYVISNSANWRDVYSTIHYANLKGVGSDFLVSTSHGPVLLNGISKKNIIKVVTSTRDKFVINYPLTIRNAGFDGVEEVVVRNANLELIDDLPDIENFVVVGGTYGYNAIAVVPYAVKKRAWVFLVDRTNIDEIDAILSRRNVKELLIYGFIEQDIRNTLQKYNPDIIDNGDRFIDNIEITKRFLKMSPTKQITLTNGEFIEKALMSGAEPILFTGKDNVPDQIANYIKSSDIEVGVLIGADLVRAATNIRRSTGISVIVKFARGARAPTGAVAAVEGLDVFYLPIPVMSLDLYSARYNRASSQLELVYRSDSTIPIFFKGTITPNIPGAERLGDIDPIFIAPNDFKTVIYPDISINENNFTISLFTIYGETPVSLEKILEKTVNVEIINVMDRCSIDIAGVKYNKQKKSFIITVKNTGDVDCWVDAELTDVFIDRGRKIIGSDGSILVKSRKTGNIIIEQELTEKELAENKFVNVVAYYGERKENLVKIIKGRFELIIEIISFATAVLILLVIVIAIVILFFLILFWRRKKEDELDEL
ncbi:MAG: hypothetical protein QXJ28_01570 [Candidatus Pacearchaeota archaeon]